MHHDLLVEVLRAGERYGLFEQSFEFRDDADRAAFEQADDVFTWLEKSREPSEWERFVRRTVFPALLSDFLHFVFEALRASRQAKLTVAYALLRKPLQDSLGILEAIAVNPSGFVRTLSNDPLRLRPMKAGGVEAHAARITEVLAAIGESDRFDAAYLARLRYDKGAEDGFDGSCNQALHLLTEHAAIRTERLNINFVFANDDNRQTLWYYLYSRLPYVLHYARLLFEHLLADFGRTDPAYLEDTERRVGAATLLWWPAVERSYRAKEIERYVNGTAQRIVQSCAAAGRRLPVPKDLPAMRDAGAFPDESLLAARLRELQFSLSSHSSAILRKALKKVEIARRLLKG